MKNTLKTMILGFGLLTFVHCQQVNPVNNLPFTPEEPTGNDITLCSDGTLNCYVEFPGTNIDQYDFGQSYDQCMNSCLTAPDSGCPSGDVPNAAELCPTMFAACDAQCNLTSSNSSLSGLPDSDGLSLPENPKAILVEVTGCFTTGMANEVHFKGPEINIVTPIEGERRVYKNSLFGAKKVQLGFATGRHPGCSGLKNRVKVKSTPIMESTVTVGSHTFTVVPFSTNAEIMNKTAAMPHSMTFSAISSKMKDEIDMSSVVVVPKSFSDVGSGVMEFNTWRYYNNSEIGYGTTVMFTALVMEPPFSSAMIAVPQTMTAYIFAKSKDSE